MARTHGSSLTSEGIAHNNMETSVLFSGSVCQQMSDQENTWRHHIKPQTPKQEGEGAIELRTLNILWKLNTNWNLRLIEGEAEIS